MKNYILVSIICCISTPLFAANIIAYKNKEKREAEFLVINSQQITKITYEEDDKVLIVSSNHSSGQSFAEWEFSVDSLEQSQEIIHKLFDRTDNDLIELKFD